jgi:hypothetical protein
MQVSSEKNRYEREFIQIIRSGKEIREKSKEQDLREVRGMENNDIARYAQGCKQRRAPEFWLSD